MNKHHPCNNIIESKLEQLTIADADHLWNDMHAILDKKMPQKKDRRRFIFWFLDAQGFLVLAFILLIIGGSYKFFLSTKELIGTTKKMSENVQRDKKNVAKVSLVHKENITVNDLDKGASNNNSTSKLLVSTLDEINPYNIKVKTLEQSNIYKAQDQFNDTIQVTSKTRLNFDIASVELKPVEQDFYIDTNYNKELDSLIKKTELKANNVKPNTMNIDHNGFYIGFMAGADLSSVHLQSAKTGSSAGFIIGYAFNNKWSIESGLHWDTKRVYDNGTYFNPPGYSPTNGITIVAVNGRNRLYEWPVNMKYKFTPGKNSLFTTAGFSSYFMKSENYDYEYTQNNQPGGHNYLSYTNEAKNWFSVVNFSLGYTHKLGGSGSFRIEPYLKLPIKNIGVGNMPIMSTGLNVGVTKKIR